MITIIVLNYIIKNSICNSLSFVKNIKMNILVYYIQQLLNNVTMKEFMFFPLLLDPTITTFFFVFQLYFIRIFTIRCFFLKGFYYVLLSVFFSMVILFWPIKILNLIPVSLFYISVQIHTYFIFLHLMYKFVNLIHICVCCLFRMWQCYIVFL